MSFAYIRRNGSKFLQKNRDFKINQPYEKFIIQQLILNFADFWWKNNVLTQNERDFKKYQTQKSS